MPTHLVTRSIITAAGIMALLGSSGCALAFEHLRPAATAEAPKGEGVLEAEPLLAKAASIWAAKHDVKIKRTFTSDDQWETQYNRNTGIVTVRFVNAMVFTADDDKCWRSHCQVSQRGQMDGTWSSPTLQCYESRKVTCESVDALPSRSASPADVAAAPAGSADVAGAPAISTEVVAANDGVREASDADERPRVASHDKSVEHSKRSKAKRKSKHNKRRSSHKK
jgi:hypothetical protein